MTTVIEKFGIKIERPAPEAKLTELGVRQWEQWTCPPSTFPFTYESRETVYVLEGKAKVTPKGENESVEILAGDLIVFPKGLSCNWVVLEAFKDHFLYHE